MSKKQEFNIDSETLEGLAKAQERQTKPWKLNSISGILVGLAIFVVSAILAWLGPAGEIDWIFNAIGLRSTLSKASPGVAGMIAGMIIIWRFKLKFPFPKSTHIL